MPWELMNKLPEKQQNDRKNDRKERVFLGCSDAWSKKVREVFAHPWKIIDPAVHDHVLECDQCWSAYVRSERTFGIRRSRRWAA